MAQIMINNYNQYQQQIHLLRTHGDVLLERIKILEIEMNKKKQQNKEVDIKDINSLNAMVKKLLRMLAKINTYEYYQLTNEPFIRVNDFYFNHICNNYFEDYLRRFITQLRLKRIRRLQILQYDESLKRINNVIEPIDFQIWQ